MRGLGDRDPLALPAEMPAVRLVSANGRYDRRFRRWTHSRGVGSDRAGVERLVWLPSCSRCKDLASEFEIHWRVRNDNRGKQSTCFVVRSDIAPSPADNTRTLPLKCKESFTVGIVAKHWCRKVEFLQQLQSNACW